MIVFNLYGGPGTGKSTTAAGVFSKIKLAGFNAELVTEYAKDVVWDKSFNKLSNQLYILGKQFHRLYRLQGQVDVVITDSPVLLSVIFNKLNKNPIPSQAFEPIIEYCYNLFDNYNIFLNRLKPFKQIGRVETEAQARNIDKMIKDSLVPKYNPFDIIDADEHAIEKISRLVITYVGPPRGETK